MHGSRRFDPRWRLDKQGWRFHKTSCNGLNSQALRITNKEPLYGIEDGALIVGKGLVSVNRRDLEFKKNC